MVRCHLSRLLGERKLKIADLVRATGLSRSTLTALYFERTERIELAAVEAICVALDCRIEDLFEIVAEGPSPATS